MSTDDELEPEERILLLIQQGADEAAENDRARMARYEAEDAQRVAVRKREDELQAQGVEDRKAEIIRLKEQLRARQDTPTKRLADKVAAMEAELQQFRQQSSAPVEHHDDHEGDQT